MSKKKYRGGVFGFGGVGQGMTTNININRWYGDEFEIIGACNRGKAKRDLAEEKFGIKAFEDPRDLVKEGLDFGLVTSTSVAHHEHTLVLAEGGVPVFCEKPIALNVTEGEEMVAAVEKADVPTVVNFGRRMAPSMQKIRDMVEKGDFGQLLAGTAFINRGHGFYAEGARHRAVVEPEESGGWTVHHACHQVDIMCWFLGEVEAVSNVTRSTVDGIEAAPGLLSEEVVMGTLMFKNGAIGHVYDCTGGVRDSHVSVTGTKCAVALAKADDTPVLKAKYHGDPEWGPCRIIDPKQDFPRKDNLNHFLEVVRDGIPSKVTLQDALYALKVTIAMRESAAKDGEVVKM